jgi:nucleotide-binding universal stress UspA family protein
MIRQILLFSDGGEETRGAIRLGSWLAGVLQVPAVLASVSEQPGDSGRLEDFFIDAETELKQAGVSYEVEQHAGRMKAIIAARSQAAGSLVVVGPHAKPEGWLTRGQLFSDLMEAVSAPILYVTGARIPIRRVLVCVGGLGYAMTSGRMGMKIAQATGAEVRILYVVPPIDLDYPSSQAVRSHLKDLSETDTLPGRSLHEALAGARELQLTASAKVRRGIVVEEIQHEVEGGDFDLVCMGSPYSSHGLRHLFTPNVTAEVAKKIRRPVLTARYEPQEPD